MAADEEPKKRPDPRIVIEPNGPYRVEGNLPLVQKRQIVSELGEPLTWQRGETYQTLGTYYLCRCGRSSRMPFCDGAHVDAEFDGTETAPTNLTAERQAIYHGHGIIVKRDYFLCMQSGFCGNRKASVESLIRRTRDPEVRARIISMIERCPSGSFSFALEEGEPDIEPDLPQQVAETTEITSEGPIRGPLWVTGEVAIERSDGKPFEARNRVTLCTCGLSKCKPLCDGSHRPYDPGHS